MVREDAKLNVGVAGDLPRVFEKRQEESFGAKLIAALRQEFGGHKVQKE